MMRALALMFLMGAAPVHADAPVSDRAQQMRFARGPVQAAAAQAYEKELARLDSLGLLDTDRQRLNRIRRIAAVLVAQAITLKPAAREWGWEIHLTSDPEVAAYSMAGGKLLVGSRFIETYNLSDDELAAALAHEIGHVIAEHVREQLFAFY